jgi:putative membrane protein
MKAGRNSWADAGAEPDPRWSLANERTLLAYIRTALSLLVAGLAVAASHTVIEAPAWLAALGLPLIALSAAVALAAGRRFLAVQRAMRLGEPLALPRIATMLPWGVAMVALGGFVMAAIAITSS